MLFGYLDLQKCELIKAIEGGFVMPTFIMLTQLSPVKQSPTEMEALEKMVAEKIRTECPELSWIHNYAILGPWDYLDVFEAPSIDLAFRASTIVRSFGHAHTEIWAATEWKNYKKMLKKLPSSE
jgi:uncharacterized protein with GYD domain